MTNRVLTSFIFLASLILPSVVVGAISRDLLAEVNKYSFLRGCFNPSYANVAINNGEAVKVNNGVQHVLIEFVSNDPIGKEDNEVLFSIIHSEFKWLKAEQDYSKLLYKCVGGYVDKVSVVTFRLNYEGQLIDAVETKYEINKAMIANPTVKSSTSVIKKEKVHEKYDEINNTLLKLLWRTSGFLAKEKGESPIRTTHDKIQDYVDVIFFFIPSIGKSKLSNYFEQYALRFAKDELTKSDLSNINSNIKYDSESFISSDKAKSNIAKYEEVGKKMWVWPTKTPSPTSSLSAPTDLKIIAQ